MNRWMSNSLPNLFNKNAKGGKTKTSKSGTLKGASLKLDLQHARLFEYTANVEMNYTALFSQLDSYHLENARVRDCGDEISMLLAQLGKISAGTSSKKQLEEVGKQFAVVEDYRNAEVQRLKAKVIDPLSTYGLKFKSLRADMRLLAKAVSRESRAKTKVDKLQMKGVAGNVVKFESAKRALQEATNDVANRKKTIDATLTEFERVRLNDVQSWLRDFIQIEMSFHAKILNAYTAAWQNVRALKPDEDLLEFRKSYLQTEAAPGQTVAQQQLVDASAYLGRSAAGQSTSGTAEYSDEEDDEDYDDEDDDDYDDDDETTASARPASGQAQPAFVKRTIS